MKRSVLTIAYFVFFLYSSAEAATNNYYVSTTGSDSNTGLTSSAAWKTITHASQALVLGSTGTVVHIAPGTYTETVITSRSGTSGARITYISDTKWGAKIASTNITNGYAWYNGGSYSDIEQFDIGSAACHGIEDDGSFQNAIANNVHNTAAGCVVGGNGGAGIDDTNYAGSGNSMVGNFVHDVGMGNTACVNHTNSTVQGLYTAQPNSSIINNLSVYNCGDGISSWHAASHTLMVNNTVLYNSQGISVGSGDAPCNVGCPGNDFTLVYNNIVAYNFHYGIYSAASDGGSIGTHNQYAYNLAYSNPSGNFDPNGAGVTCTPGCLTSNPLFVNNTGTSSGDYHLQSGSPATGAGTTTDAPAKDFDGVTRTPPISVGAFQSAGVSPVVADPYWKLDDGSGAVALDSSGNNDTMSLFNSPIWQGYTNCVLNACLSFNGTNQYGSVSLNLSSTNVITIAFWMKWNAYQNDDKLAFEFSSDFNNSTTGFLIDPDESSSGEFWVSVHGNAGYNNAAFPRPSAGVWHHYAFILNKGAGTANQVTPYVDGTAVPYTKSAYSANNTNNFGSNTLFAMSRNGSTLFGAGSLNEVHIYLTALSPSDIAALARH